MPRKKPDIFYIYKTTNLINNKFYIGKHCTTKIENDYLGSGKRLRYSIRKYGKENFKKEILEFCENHEVLAVREKEIVNQEMLNNSLCMNLMIGGEGGYNFKSIEDANNFSKMGLNKKKLLWETDKNWADKTRRNMSNGIKKVLPKIKKSLTELYKIKGGNFKNKKHSEESKNKIRNSHKGKGLKESNSQFGTMWVTNGIINKKIKQTDIIPQGYYKGRRILEYSFNG